MSVSIKTLEDYGFLFCFLGGALTTVMAFLGFIISLAGQNIHWFFGAGYIGIASPIAGTIVSLIFGILALLIGLKLFIPSLANFLTKINSIILAVIVMVIGIIVFGIGGLLILAGGILILIHSLKKSTSM